MKKYRLLTLMVLLLVLTGSCTKYVEGYEKDPNGLLETNGEQIMQGVLLENQFFLKGDGIRIAMMWMNQATGSDRQYLSFNDWNLVSNNNFNDEWSEVYSTLSEARVMEAIAEKEQNFKLRGLAKLMRAWAGGEAASLWGDVPFSQAGLPDKYSDPKYDKQSDVFNQVQALLDEAITDLNNPVGVIYPQKDIYFGGDVAKWIKVAHGLKARFYLHTKDYANAKSEAANGPSSSDDDVVAPYNSYNGPEGKWNPTFQFYWNRDGYLSADGTYAGDLIINGTRNNSKTDETARSYFNYDFKDWWGGATWHLNVMADGWISDGVTGKFAGKMKLLSYGEMLLIQAESEARLNGVAAALPIYNIYRALLATGYDTGSWDTLGPTLQYDAYVASDFAAGGMENADNVSDKQAFLREIMEERYVYFIGDYESFVDFSRTFGDTDVPPYVTLKTGNAGLPLRFIYPQSEIDANDNFPGTAPRVTEKLPIYN